ncbi:hypothetical protein ACFSQD_09390 [Flavihumibacter stibioxidans]|uniref:Uncharacterized protein n=1 Tax=Flavihumibacter stibioxidans TaxID=1834163 RepID=A0ABR7M681_9BACT|nr:hypothetical protein [Flavihumibacter stibioxidans]MBC6490527.1 hypothetical protein [Flavihumibacter stibioxidans]
MKTIKTLFPFFAILLAVGLLSCKKNDNNPSNPGQSNGFPFLKQGNEWIYDYKAVDAESIVKYKILSKEANGYYKVNWFMGADFEIYWHEANGAFSNFTDGPSGTMKFLLCKTNSKPGDSWGETAFDDTYEKTVTVTNKVMAIDAFASTPAGNFTNCIKVRQTNSAYTEYFFDYYISPVYGIVKMEGMGYKNEDGEITHFPLSYILKSKNF